MPVLSFQHDAAFQYLGKAMNLGVDIPSPVSYHDPAAEMGQQNTVLPHSTATAGSFGAKTSWRSTHLGAHQSLQKGNIRTTVDFDTARVNPGAF